MNGVRKVTEDLYWVGVNDKRTELFEKYSSNSGGRFLQCVSVVR